VFHGKDCLYFLRYKTGKQSIQNKVSWHCHRFNHTNDSKKENRCICCKVRVCYNEENCTIYKRVNQCLKNNTPVSEKDNLHVKYFIHKRCCHCGMV